MAIPDTLRRKMQGFALAGHLHSLPRDIFADANWLQVLVGQGLQPQRHHPLADLLSDAECEFFLQQVHQSFARIAHQLPAHGEFLAHCCAKER